MRISRTIRRSRTGRPTAIRTSAKSRLPTPRSAGCSRRSRRAGCSTGSIVVVAGDHGESLGEHGEDDHGIFVYDSTIRVPLVIRAPKTSPRRTGGIVRLTDVMPTVLDLLHVAAPPSDGTSLAAVIHGRTADLDLEAYAESRYPERLGWSPLRSLRAGRFKLIDAPRPELYDLERDPFEEHNIYPDRPSVALAMQQRLRLIGRETDLASAPALASVPAALQERLAAVGYVASGPAQAPSAAAGSAPDPKDVNRCLPCAAAVDGKTQNSEFCLLPFPPRGSKLGSRAAHADHPFAQGLRRVHRRIRRRRRHGRQGPDRSRRRRRDARGRADVGLGQGQRDVRVELRLADARLGRRQEAVRHLRRLPRRLGHRRRAVHRRHAAPGAGSAAACSAAARTTGAASRCASVPTTSGARASTGSATTGRSPTTTSSRTTTSSTSSSASSARNHATRDRAAQRAGRHLPAAAEAARARAADQEGVRPAEDSGRAVAAVDPDAGRSTAAPRATTAASAAAAARRTRTSRACR